MKRNALLIMLFLALGQFAMVKAQPGAAPTIPNYAMVREQINPTVTGWNGWYNCTADISGDYRHLAATDNNGEGGLNMNEVNVSGFNDPYLYVAVYASQQATINLTIVTNYVGQRNWSVNEEATKAVTLNQGWNNVLVKLNELNIVNDPQKEHLFQIGFKELPNGINLYIPQNGGFFFFDALPRAPEFNGTGKKVIFSVCNDVNQSLWYWDNGNYSVPGSNAETRNYVGTTGDPKIYQAFNKEWFLINLNGGNADVSGYNRMHVDVYSTSTHGFCVTPVTNNGTEVNKETEQDGNSNYFSSLTANQWNSLDVKLDAAPFLGEANFDLSNLSRFVFSKGDGTATYALDNLYFWKDPLANATLTSAKGTDVYQFVNLPLTATFTYESGDQVDLAALSNLTYSVEGVGSVTNEGVFTSEVAGTATVKVSGTLGDVTKEATIAINVLAIPEPADPNKPLLNVTSLYSDTYPKHGEFWKDGQVWTDATAKGEYVYTSDASNHFVLAQNLGSYMTVGLNASVSKYKYLHVDVFQLTGDNKNLYVNPQQGTKEPADTRNDNTKVACQKGQWVGVDIDLTQAPFDTYGDFRQIAFLSEAGNPANESFAIDNVYFWQETPEVVTTDTDGKGINWDTTKGTTCYYDKIVWQKIGNGTPKTDDARFKKTHDGDNLTYYTITPDELHGEQHVQLLLQLKQGIRISDVELVWANGFPKVYDVYAFNEWPVVGNEIPIEKLTAANKLFSVDKMLAYEPYFETHSNLQDSVQTTSNYILIDMQERGEKSTFGYYLAEAHVGAYDDDYNTPDHLGFPDYVIVTDEDQVLDITVRNKRNAILEGYTINAGSIETRWASPQLKKRNNQDAVVYATSQGDYRVSIEGELSNSDVKLNTGYGNITVNKNWTSSDDASGFKSYVQRVYQSKTDSVARAAVFTASREQTNFNAYLAGDGEEPSPADVMTRWSSYTNYDGSDDGKDIPWDGSEAAANRRKEANKNQYWMIDFENTYEITNVELVWERAYAPEYTVFGFETLPTGEDLNKSYDDFVSTYESNILYKGVNDASNITMYPLHDEHSTLSSSGALEENNRTRYMLIKMNEPAEQDGDYFGFSLWEVYAWGADLTVTDNVKNLSAPNTSVKAGYEAALTITAFGGTETDGHYQYEESEWYPVSFAINEPGYHTKTVPVTDEESGTKLKRFYIYKGEETDEPNESNTVAIITDNNNGTYGIVAGKYGYGQTKDTYDNHITDGGDDDISFTITMTSTNTKNETITGQFELVVYKEAMALLTDGSSTDKNQKYDDGYFDADVMRNNVKSTTTTIDLRNVDFVSDNAGNLLGTTTIPAPHTMKSAGGTQLNPNTILYTDEKTITGDGNLAVRRQDDGTWRVNVLRIFDGWDWDPIKNEGGLIANQATFYTSLKANQYSFIALPFVPTYGSVNDKGVKLYKPVAFNADRKVVQIEELEENEYASGFEGKPYVIRTENEELYKPGGYGVAFKSNGQVSVPYDPASWTDDENGATITSTYVKQTLTTSDDTNNFYLFSSAYEMFLPVGNEKLKDDKYNSETETLSATEVMPFYAYLALGKEYSPAKYEQISFFLGAFEEEVPEEVIPSEGEETTEPAEEPTEDLTVTAIMALLRQGKVTIYDMQGRNVGTRFGASIPSGLYIIKTDNGNTRKVSIK